MSLVSVRKKYADILTFVNILQYTECIHVKKMCLIIFDKYKTIQLKLDNFFSYIKNKNTAV